MCDPCTTRDEVYGGFNNNVCFQYDLLCLKRHQASRFMPKYYVFPGGNIDPADSNLKWYELFAKFHFDNDSFMSLVPKTAVRPQIFKSQPNELPKEISLRITAIRETFEECGVLMCKVDREFSAWAQPLSGEKPCQVIDICKSICSKVNA